MMLAWLLACGRPVESADLAACSALPEMTAREDCRLRVIEPLFRAEDPGAFDAALSSLEDPASRDLVRLRLSIDDPSEAGRLCEQAETAPAKEKCRQVLGRPHLRGRRRSE